MTHVCPPYMNQGSEGPCVLLLKVLLFGAGHAEGLVHDDKYDGVTAGLVSDLQNQLGGLDRDGNFGPATRRRVQEVCGFNFQEACNWVPGTTGFRQPSGEVIRWSRQAP